MANATVVLALSARLSALQRETFARRGIDVWDLDSIADNFCGQLNQVAHPLLRPMLFAVAALHEPDLGQTVDARLLADLTGMQPGRDGWVAYQRLIARIF